MSISEYIKLSGKTYTPNNNGKLATTSSNITNITQTNDTSWLYSSSIGTWWTMTADSLDFHNYIRVARAMDSTGTVGSFIVSTNLVVRPVITITK